MIKKIIKKTIAITLIFTLVFGLAACSSAGGRKDYEVVGTVTDACGRTLDIRSNANESTIASVYFVAAPFFVALGISDRVLAVNARTTFWTMADEGLGKAGTVGKGNVDLEKLAAYAPTALVHRSNDPETIEAVEKLGIDCICITVENMNDIISTLDLLGAYFGVPENAKAAKDWIESEFAYIDSIVEKIPVSERKTAMLLGGELGRVAGSDMLQTWMIEKAGGIPVVQEGKDHNWVDIGVEKVFSYNPDVLFCTSSAARSYTKEEIYADSAWSALTAVKNREIYQIPTKGDSWDMPGLSCALGTLYMLHEMYPEYLSVSDLEDEVDSYYRFMFGRCFDEELELDWDNFE